MIKVIFAEFWFVVESVEEIVNKKSGPDFDELLKGYKRAYEILAGECESLHDVRLEALKVIQFVESLVSSIANKPKSFDVEIDEIKHEREAFKKAEDFAREEWVLAKRAALGSGSGAMAGAAFAAMAPTAAMWTATTFGTASTGVAISSLSGAAATNAALAWLGGGALTAGGGGIAGGGALLALAGPVGWGIAGAATVSSAGLYMHKKRKNAALKSEEMQRIQEATYQAKKIVQEIQTLRWKTKKLLKNLDKECVVLSSLYLADYSVLGEDQRLSLGKLVNNTLTLMVLVNQKFEL